MWKYLKKYKCENFGISVLAFLSRFFTVLQTLYWTYLIDQMLQHNMRELYIGIGIQFGIAMTARLLNYWKERRIAIVIEKMNTDLRGDISRKVMGNSLKEFSEKDTGDYISWYTNDIKEAELRGFKNVFTLLDNVFMFVLGGLALIRIHYSLFLLSLLTAFVMQKMSKRYDKALQEAGEQVSDAMEVFTVTAKEQLAGFHVFKSFGLMKQFTDHMRNGAEKLENERYKFDKKESIISMKISLPGIITTCVTQMSTFLLIAFGVLPISILVTVIDMTGFVANTIPTILNVRAKLIGAKVYFDKIQDYSVLEEPKKEVLPQITDSIEVENLSFAYTDKPVLQNLNLEFKRGGKYAIVGKSGCGKSTLLKILLGQLDGYKGAVLFDGKEANRYNVDSFYRQMAYIEQNVFLFNRSIRENITMGDPFTEEELQKALIGSALNQDLHFFREGLETLVGENGNHLSGGQKQRVAIARALIHNRSILLIDEGTSALDKENATIIEDSLLKVKDMTVIFVNHYLREEKKKEYTAIYQLGSE